MNGPILVRATNQNPVSICTLEKYLVIKSSAGSSVITEPSGSLKVPYVGLQRKRDSNMPHCSSYACSYSIVKDSISKLSFCYPLNRPELKM